SFSSRLRSLRKRNGSTDVRSTGASQIFKIRSLSNRPLLYGLNGNSMPTSRTFQFFALHQKGKWCELRIVLHLRIIKDGGHVSNRTAFADFQAIGLHDAIFEKMRLNNCSGI